MRSLTDRSLIDALMQALGRAARSPGRVYFTGGVTAVLFGWRDSTVDVDLKFLPELNEVFRAIPSIKEDLHVNVELASPADFIPELPGWPDRSIFIGRVGRLDFYHYDPYSQALSKIERGHAQDREDVNAMFRDGLIAPDKLGELFESITPELYKYPALDPTKFSQKVGQTIHGFSPSDS